MMGGGEMPDRGDIAGDKRTVRGSTAIGVGTVQGTSGQPQGEVMEGSGAVMGDRGLSQGGAGEANLEIVHTCSVQIEIPSKTLRAGNKPAKVYCILTIPRVFLRVVQVVQEGVNVHETLYVCVIRCRRRSESFEEILPFFVEFKNVAWVES